MLKLLPANAIRVNAIGERLLQKHLSAESFQTGEARQLWQLVQVEWPYAVFRIGAASVARAVGLRLRLEKYPVAPPLVQLWDLEALTPIEAHHWPEPFIRFASQSYPHFVDLEATAYCSTLLRISVEVARRRAQPASLTWDVNGDLTQLLVRISDCFRCPESAPLQFPSRCVGNRS